MAQRPRSEPVTPPQEHRKQRPRTTADTSSDEKSLSERGVSNTHPATAPTAVPAIAPIAYTHSYANRRADYRANYHASCRANRLHPFIRHLPCQLSRGSPTSTHAPTAIPTIAPIATPTVAPIAYIHPCANYRADNRADRLHPLMRHLPCQLWRQSPTSAQLPCRLSHPSPTSTQLPCRLTRQSPSSAQLPYRSHPPFRRSATVGPVISAPIVTCGGGR